MSEYGRHGDLDYSGHPVFPDPPTQELPPGEPLVVGGYGAATFPDEPYPNEPYPNEPYPNGADHLDEDPFKDDLSQQLAAREPQRWANRATAILAGVVLLVGGFLGGTQVEKHWGHLSPASGTGNSATNGGAGGGGAGAYAGGGNFGGGAGGGGAGGTGAGGGGGGAGAGATTGTVKFVDGTTVYITTADGSVVTVKTDGSTAVQVTQQGTVKDLPVGSTVAVVGQTGSDGTVTASRIVKTK